MSDRRNQIAARKKKKKQKSKPLTPIFFCDADGCLNISDNDERMWCPRCSCFYYCSSECQKSHWSKHKLMCGNNPTPEFIEKKKLYMAARDAAESIYQRVKDGNYITVIHEPGDVPAAIFSTLATEKSNVLNWRHYLKDVLFTTASYTGFGSLGNKIQAAYNAYEPDKLFVISVIFDRLRDGETTECVVRLFVADDYGETMNAPDGKVIKQVVRYKRK